MQYPQGGLGDPITHNIVNKMAYLVIWVFTKITRFSKKSNFKERKEKKKERKSSHFTCLRYISVLIVKRSVMRTFYSSKCTCTSTLDKRRIVRFILQSDRLVVGILQIVKTEIGNWNLPLHSIAHVIFECNKSFGWSVVKNVIDEQELVHNHFDSSLRENTPLYEIW